MLVEGCLLSSDSSKMLRSGVGRATLKLSGNCEDESVSVLTYLVANTEH